MIAGGLGGLGRSAATWMARRGAKNLILLSRSGGNGSEAAANLVKDLKSLGIRVKTPKCDVASLESLASALAQCSDMPLIKGCIQGTMVLQVSGTSHTSLPFYMFISAASNVGRAEDVIG